VETANKSPPQGIERETPGKGNTSLKNKKMLAGAKKCEWVIMSGRRAQRPNALKEKRLVEHRLPKGSAMLKTTKKVNLPKVWRVQRNKHHGR